MSTKVTLNGNSYEVPGDYGTDEAYQYQKLIGLLRSGSITTGMLTNIHRQMLDATEFTRFSLNLVAETVDLGFTTPDLIHRVIADYELEKIIKE